MLIKKKYLRTNTMNKDNEIIKYALCLQNSLGIDLEK